MRATRYFGLLGLAGLLAGGGLYGCKSTTDESPAAGGATTTTTTTSHTTTSSTTSQGGGGSGAGNHTFDTAIDIPLDSNAVPGTLADPTTPDYYKFTLDKTYPFAAYVDAQRLITNSTDLSDPTIIDTVVSIYDSSKNLIASDDDEWPRFSTDSQVYTELDAGDYYIKVEDCNAYKAENPSSDISCADPSQIVTLDYELTAFPLDTTKFPQGTVAGTTVTYTESTTTAGEYENQLISGAFAAANETHKFTLTIPANLKIDSSSRARVWVWPQPIGPVNGDGSTSNIKIWATSDSAGTALLGAADQNNYKDGDNKTNGPMQFSFPLALTAGGTLDTTATYYVWVQDTGDTSYYFLENGVGSLYYGELEVSTAHGDAASAQALTVPGTNEGTYFPDGNLTTPTETDWYSFTVPATVKDKDGNEVAPDRTALECQSAREGSGLLGFSATLMDKNGAATSVKLTELNPALVDLTLGWDGLTQLPANVTPGQKAYLKIAATGQDANNPATYYRCFVAFYKYSP